jgi:hypothetical protein
LNKKLKTVIKKINGKYKNEENSKPPVKEISNV